MSGLPQPDFLRPAAAAGALAWVWCATGLLVFAVAAWDASQAWRARGQAQQALAETGRARAAAARMDASTSAGTARLAPTTGEAPGSESMAAGGQAAVAVPGQGAAWAQWQAQWAPRLAYPWAQVFAATDATPPAGVAWLAVAHVPGQALRLDGLAPTQAQALAALELLRAPAAGGASAWASGRLVQSQQQDGRQRFTLNARLADPVAWPVRAVGPDAGPHAGPSAAAAMAKTDPQR